MFSVMVELGLVEAKEKRSVSKEADPLFYRANTNKNAIIFSSRAENPRVLTRG